MRRWNAKKKPKHSSILKIRTNMKDMELFAKLIRLFSKKKSYKILWFTCIVKYKQTEVLR